MAQASISLSPRTKFYQTPLRGHALAMQEAMRYARGLDDDLAPGAIQIAIEELADVFDSDNGQFRRERFVRACEPGASNGNG